MDIVKNAKNVASEIEQGIEAGLHKGKGTLANVASHLPFANLANKDDKHFAVEVDLPGVNKEDIVINVDGNRLDVSAVRSMKKEVKQDDYYMQESFYGKIARTFILSDDLDKDNIDAELTDGRLYIALKKTPAAEPRVINVK